MGGAVQEVVLLGGCFPGGWCCLGDGTIQGGGPGGGVLSVTGSDIMTPPSRPCGQNDLTHTSENITLPITSFAGGN